MFCAAFALATSTEAMALAMVSADFGSSLSIA